MVSEQGGEVSAERGYLREAGNLLFHVSVMIVLVGFALGGLFGYKGGVIVNVGSGFANTLNEYDDFVPGSMFDPNQMEDFSFAIDDFSVEWIESGRGQGLARKFVSSLTYRESKDAPRRTYDLKVNHPLSIGGTEVFLIGHGYAPIITVRDAQGRIESTGPTVFLPQDNNFFSFGVVKVPSAKPVQLGLEGFFYPTYAVVDGTPINVMGDLRNPTLSLHAFTGDLGLDSGKSQSIYVLDKTNATPLKRADGKLLGIDLQVGDRVTLPDGLGSVSFDGVQKWNKLQISRTPGTRIALIGVLLALVGMLASLYIRPRRVWVRVRPSSSAGQDGTMVEVAGLDRSGNGNIPDELNTIIELIKQEAST